MLSRMIIPEAIEVRRSEEPRRGFATSPGLFRGWWRISERFGWAMVQTLDTGRQDEVGEIEGIESIYQANGAKLSTKNEEAVGRPGIVKLDDPLTRVVNRSINVQRRLQQPTTGRKSDVCARLPPLGRIGAVSWHDATQWHNEAINAVAERSRMGLYGSRIG